MARIEIDPNYSSPTFSRATAGTDQFKQQDVQALAEAVSTHTHAAGKGLAVSGPINGSQIVSGTLPGTALATGTVSSVKIANGAVSFQTGTYIQTAAAGISTTSAAFSTIPFMDTPITVDGTGNVVFLATFSWGVSAATTATFGLSVDSGGDVPTYNAVVAPTAGQRDIQTMCLNLGVLTAGAHVIHMRWAVQGGATLSINQSTVQTLALEFKK